MHQIQFWAVIASLLTVFPAHALSPDLSVQSRLAGSTDANSDGFKGVQVDNILAQETPSPEPAPEPAPETPSPKPSPTPSPTPSPSPTPAPAEAPESSNFILNEQGELGEGDSVLASDSSLYDEYSFEGKQGQEVTISLDSSEFDTYLAIFTPDNKLLEEHDDISQSNSNSQITVTLPSDGTYRVIVNSYDDKGRGKYNLTIK